MLEGELIKRQTEEDLEREKMRELARQKKVAEMRADLAEANKQQQKAKEAERLREIEEDLRVEEHSKKKDAMDLMKKEREEQRFKDK